MAISIVQLGSERKNKGLLIGAVRRPPRGVRKEDYARLNYFDVWLPILSPSLQLMKLGRQAGDQKSWSQFTRKFKAEMKKPEPASVLRLLAQLSHQTDLSIGCYCQNENRCHRSLLRQMLADLGANGL